MNIAENILQIKKELPESVRLVVVSKLHSGLMIMEAYNAGQRIFGESRVQELLSKRELLPKDIEWHFIGHLQVNKVKYIVPFIHTIQSVDSLKLLEYINKEAAKLGRTVHVLLQVHIAEEKHKFGFYFEELISVFEKIQAKSFPYICFSGLMGMATLTKSDAQISGEFSKLNDFFKKVKADYFAANNDFNTLSMGMSEDYQLAIGKGSTMVRIGSKIFGTHYLKF
ncbi:MAG: YggS family pyridoxal phosphate-dependent enzyme [Candidatus Symbiothrix sp.]|jgi:pyridoxal phosphate enzyme (YggS family)|nr:YggS family pyridoxal phosphate-dependent enzyme [Candidatus Symbiothrix sp.]